MATSKVTSDVEWQKVRRVHRTTRFMPQITIRQTRGQFAVSADFVRMANISDCTRASLFLSADGHRLAFNFHSDERDDDAFLLSRDGGGSGASAPNRVINAGALLSQSATMTALCKEDIRVRRCEPQKDCHGRWVIYLAPCFEKVLIQPDQIPDLATGIYRYRSGQETIYIGRGNLRDRLAVPERRAWEFDRVEYSILNDDVIERRWEAFWLDEYRQRNNRWPIYNRIAAASGIPTKAG
jgi:hypothetical protein